MPTPYAKRLAAKAMKEYDTYRFYSENDPKLAARIPIYWKATTSKFTSVSVAWSAVFISWCVKDAGATSADFDFSPRHSKFVHTAIQNAAASTGVFRAYPITAYAPQVGDIIHNNRDGNSFDYAHAKSHQQYDSHSAIVVETGIDSIGPYAMTVGGNESDSVRRKRVTLTSAGFVKQRPLSPFICVIQNLK